MKHSPISSGFLANLSGHSHSYGSSWMLLLSLLKDTYCDRISYLVQPNICEDRIYSNSSMLPKNKLFYPKTLGKAWPSLLVSVSV